MGRTIVLFLRDLRQVQALGSSSDPLGSMGEKLLLFLPFDANALPECFPHDLLIILIFLTPLTTHRGHDKQEDRKKCRKLFHLPFSILPFKSSKAP